MGERVTIVHPRRVRLLGLVALVLGLAPPLPATAQPARDPFASAATADPLDLARLAHAEGDGAVLERLADDRPFATRLAAIRATPHLSAPEAALPALARIASGRDADLAPAAALAALRIARDLGAFDLERREAPLPPLREARAAFARLAGDEAARADIRRAAAFVADALAAVAGTARGAGRRESP